MPPPPKYAPVHSNEALRSRLVLSLAAKTTYHQLIDWLTIRPNKDNKINVVVSIVWYDYCYIICFLKHYFDPLWELKSTKLLTKKMTQWNNNALTTKFTFSWESLCIKGNLELHVCKIMPNSIAYQPRSHEILMFVCLLKYLSLVLDVDNVMSVSNIVTSQWYCVLRWQKNIYFS